MDMLDALILYMLSMRMVFEDSTQRFTAMNNTLSKIETQQKITQGQVANSLEVQLRFFIEHSLKARLIANSKLGPPAALFTHPSAPSSSTVSNIDDSDQDFRAYQKKKRK
ncbi:MAG: hypothetical protein EZS28_002783 [Streblomastix strix]|uniref:Uncharacterized protein n=1 Tax=Streblomastix strix TaxID=222440 RepID=A0A5J4X3B0_9EUKA|nr:MAG: hypothetical protein EZS28_002783 [Streblomastix strix]